MLSYPSTVLPPLAIFAVVYVVWRLWGELRGSIVKLSEATDDAPTLLRHLMNIEWFVLLALFIVLLVGIHALGKVY